MGPDDVILFTTERNFTRRDLTRDCMSCMRRESLDYRTGKVVSWVSAAEVTQKYSVRDPWGTFEIKGGSCGV